jgi:type VI secretion system protein ImpE
VLSSGELVASGRIEEAISVLQAEVRARPTDAAKRFELGETLVVLGEWARADTQLDLASTQDTTFGVTVALIRQLIRGEMARAEVFTQGRTPEVVGEATPEVVGALRLLLDLRDPAVSEIAPPDDNVLTGEVDGRPFTGIRDLDDRVAPVLEVLTSTGKYYWIPWARVLSLELTAPARLRDLVWRPAELDVADGPSGVVYIPALYQCGPGEADSDARLGRATRWEEEKGLARGIGQRCFLIGEEDLALSDFTTLTITGAPAS